MIHSTQMYIPLKPLFSKHKGGGVQFTDEPTGALDSKNGNEVLTLLQDSVKKLDQTLVLITHNIDLAREADRIIKIADGKIVDQRGMNK